MAAFLREYPDIHWGVWMVVFVVLAVPFLSTRAGKLSVIWLQLVNLLLTAAVTGIVSGPSHTVDGDWAMATAMLYGFGVGYSLLARRRRERRERVLGTLGLAVYGFLTLATMWCYMGVP